MGNETYRLFFCAHCNRRVAICASCDYGNRYCPQRPCAEQARREAKRRYRADYQRTRDGRRTHARAQMRYRLRLNLQKVTDHPSPRPAPSTTVQSNQAREEELVDVDTPVPPPVRERCHFCGAACGPFMHRWTGRW